uniref:Uncharacterized protein n=1 Tax=Araneus ventricosus TaxID=182803 RepID=A0A4Y2HPZ9_ARAVE|nr:hypothetical protein AVEN_120167-1 [Araneus ventricosus]
MTSSIFIDVRVAISSVLRSFWHRKKQFEEEYETAEHNFTSPRFENSFTTLVLILLHLDLRTSYSGSSCSSSSHLQAMREARRPGPHPAQVLRLRAGAVLPESTGRQVRPLHGLRLPALPLQCRTADSYLLPVSSR